MKNKKKTIILSSIILGALVLTLGITYAIFTYNAQSANQQLILGDIWMSYNETSTNIQLKDAMPQELLADDFIAKKAYLNPIMKEQTVEYENELTACVTFLDSSGMPLENGTMTDFCQGTGTAINGYTFQENLDNGDWFPYEIVSEMLSLNIITEHKFLLDVDLPYFEFQVNGRNTYTEQDIKYEIVLNNSEYIDENGLKTERIADKFLKFSLVEINDLGPELVFHNQSYEDLTNKSVFTNTISNTDGTINRTYRLYMWIGDEVIIGGGEAAYDYDMETWNKIYASVRVDVKGDFIDKEVVNDYVPATDSASFKRLVNNQFQDTTYIDTDGTVYLSGTNEEVNYNYVWYSGKLWRITSINPDGTMKMITDGLMTSISFGENHEFYIDENTTSYRYQWLNQEFLPTLYNYENIIVEDAVWNASPGNGEISSKLPISGQEEVSVNASVGLLNSYEYYKSYQNTLSGSGYLDRDYEWGLLNPYNASLLYVWYAGVDGDVGYNNQFEMNGVRPSIYLKSGVQFVGGNGTVDNPYRIKGDNENIEENVTLINTRKSGEYVKLSNDETAPTFRIVGTENRNGTAITKLVLNDFVRDTNDVDSDGNKTEVLERSFATTNSWSSVSETDPTYWRGYLNSVWIKEVDPTYNFETGTFGMLDKGTYYLGGVTESNRNYKIAVCKTFDNKNSIQDCIEENTEETSTIQESITDYSGLLRYGEMFASQFKTGYGNSSNYWLITPYSSLNELAAGNTGYIFADGSSNMHAARPTIHLKSEIVIKSGSGTEQDPFVVGLPS